MGLLMINEAAGKMGQTGHVFSEAEKEFVVQFAYKTGDKELTDRLIDDLCGCGGKDESTAVMGRYGTMYDAKPDWLDAIENIIVSLEMYRREEEKAIEKLSELLSACGIKLSGEEVKKTDLTELKKQVRMEAGR